MPTTACPSMINSASGSYAIPPSSSPAAFSSSIACLAERVMDANDAVTVTDLPSGDYQLQLSGISPDCLLSGSPDRTASVSEGTASTVAYELECAAIGKIVFTRGEPADGDIWTIEGNGENALALSDHEQSEVFPRWSPDGSRVAYMRDDFGTHDIFTTSEFGGSTNHMVDDPDNDAGPIWTRDVNVILCVSDRTGDLDVWASDAAGTISANLTEDPDVDTDPQPSPDGSQIAFSSDRSGDMDIWVIDADGSNPMNLTDDANGNDSPHWSLDGTRIVYSSFRASATGHMGRRFTAHAAH